MSEFQPITTQEEFDEAIKGRLQREKQKYSDYEEIKGKLANYETQIGELNGALQSANDKIATFDAELADRDSKISALETSSLRTRIAHETGLGFDAVSFLNGNTEDEIKASAEALKGIIKKSVVPPQASGEPATGGAGSNATSNAMKQMLNNLNLGGN